MPRQPGGVRGVVANTAVSRPVELQGGDDTNLDWETPTLEYTDQMRAAIAKTRVRPGHDAAYEDDDKNALVGHLMEAAMRMIGRPRERYPRTYRAAVDKATNTRILDTRVFSKWGGFRDLNHKADAADALAQAHGLDYMLNAPLMLSILALKMLRDVAGNGDRSSRIITRHKMWAKLPTAMDVWEASRTDLYFSMVCPPYASFFKDGSCMETYEQLLAAAPAVESPSPIGTSSIVSSPIGNDPSSTPIKEEDNPEDDLEDDPEGDLKDGPEADLEDDPQDDLEAGPENDPEDYLGDHQKDGPGDGPEHGPDENCPEEVGSERDPEDGPEKGGDGTEAAIPSPPVRLVQPALNSAMLIDRVRGCKPAPPPPDTRLPASRFSYPSTRRMTREEAMDKVGDLVGEMKHAPSDRCDQLKERLSAVLDEPTVILMEPAARLQLALGIKKWKMDMPQLELLESHLMTDQQEASVPQERALELPPVWTNMPISNIADDFTILGNSIQSPELSSFVLLRANQMRATEYFYHDCIRELTFLGATKRKTADLGAHDEPSTGAEDMLPPKPKRLHRRSEQPAASHASTERRHDAERGARGPSPGRRRPDPVVTETVAMEMAQVGLALDGMAADPSARRIEAVRRGLWFLAGQLGGDDCQRAVEEFAERNSAEVERQLAARL